MIVTLLLWVTLLIVSIGIKQTKSNISNFTYVETVKYEGNTLPHVWNSIVYDDGTIVLRIVREDPGSNKLIPNATISNTTMCLQNLLSLRILFSNGTVIEQNIDLEIQSLNYCISKLDVNSDLFDPIKLYALNTNYVLVTYYNATNVNDNSTYSYWGMVVDWNGNKYRPINFGPTIFSMQNMNSVCRNINPDKGFLRLSISSNAIDWRQYIMADNGDINQLNATGTIDISGSFRSTLFEAISTVNEDYAIIFGSTFNSTSNSTSNNSSDILSSHGTLRIYPLEYNKNSTGTSLLLWQTSLQNLTFSYLQCVVSNTGVGHMCTMTVTQSVQSEDDSDIIINNVFYVKVTFLSSGSALGFTTLNHNLPQSVPENVDQLIIKPLPCGGYLLSAYTSNATGVFFYGYIFNETGQDPIPWELSIPVNLNIAGVTTILPNNSMILALNETVDTWRLLTVDLPNLLNISYVYSNPAIDSTYPSINASMLDASSLLYLNVTFRNSVELSDGKISIYQSGSTTRIQNLRQSTPANLCTIIDDLTVKVNILPCTFSVPGASYYVMFDNNFVMNYAYKEPIIGLRDPPKEDIFAASETGLLRLTVNGTMYLDSLNKNLRSQFFSNLTAELSRMIPVDQSRLSTNGISQVDPSNNAEKQELINLEIKSTNDPGQPNVNRIINILDNLIKNKDYTPISQGQTTQYLDSVYGFQQSPDLWQKYMMRFILIFVAISIPIILFIIARCKNKKGHNIVIIHLGLIIFDVVITSLFVGNNGKDVIWLYIPRDTESRYSNYNGGINVVDNDTRYPTDETYDDDIIEVV
ncbi:11715_t:CDS:2, partial [Dentiscutata heterogama]